MSFMTIYIIYQIYINLPNCTFWIRIAPATGSEFNWITFLCIHTPLAKHTRAINAKVTVCV